MKELTEQFRNGYVDKNLMPGFDYSDPSSVALQDYRVWFAQYGNMVPGNLTDCDLEKEMQKVKIFIYLFSVFGLSSNCFSVILCI